MQCGAIVVSRLLPCVATAVAWWLATSIPVMGIVGGAPIVGPTIARHVALVWGTGGACSGAAIAPDLVLTAAHCARSSPSEIYVAILYDAQRLVQVTATRVIPHPQFDKAGDSHTADLAILKLPSSVTGHVFPAPLSDKEAIWKAEQFVVAGFGLTEPLGTLPRADWNVHAATLVLSGLPSAQTLELVDSSTRGKALGFGACYGDSGAPVFEETSGRLALIGIVTAGNGLGRAAGCGATTGVTVLVQHLTWISETATLLGSSLAK